MATISMKPWGDVTQADYADAGAYCDACLVNTNDGPRARWSKDNCKLPVREPGGAVNRNALGAAAAALAGARGGVDLAPDEKRAAARGLTRLYAQAGMPVPDSLTAMTR